jgi:hypothetical protein
VSTPLPGMPDLPPASPKKTVQGWQAAKVRTTRLCERCCRDIHRYGIEVAPYPRVARWRVTNEGISERLCEAHKVEACT